MMARIPYIKEHEHPELVAMIAAYSFVSRFPVALEIEPGD